MHPFELTRRLIEIESITDNEKAVAFFLRDYLAGLGYAVALQTVTPERFNVIARCGSPELVFSTHLDTVPPYIPYSEDETYIYGRGACDAKGILAAQIGAAEQLRAEGIHDIALLFVVGEESGSKGALAANKAPLRSKFLIDGEPTENKLAIGSKGCLRAEIVTRGKAAHSAYPGQGESAILKLLDLLAAIRRMAFDPHPLLGDTTCNIGIIEGGERVNIIPDRARAEIMFRTVQPANDIKDRLNALVGGKAEIRYAFEAPPMMMNVLPDFETAVVSFTSDVPTLTDWGKPFMLGPGSILDAHSAHERISKKDLLDGVQLYVKLARQLLG